MTEYRSKSFDGGYRARKQGCLAFSILLLVAGVATLIVTGWAVAVYVV